MLIPTNNNKKLRTGHDGFTAIKSIMSGLALTTEPIHRKTLLKLEVTNYILTTEGGERGNFVCVMSIQRNTVILFNVRFNFKISTASVAVE